MSRLSRLARALAVITTRLPVATSSTPLKLRNPLNGSGGATKGARYATNARRQKERMAGRTLALRLDPRHAGLTDDAHCVVLTRISPRPFDDDNNAAALKSVRDGMAEWWGINDGSDDVVWVCDWRKGAKDAVEAALWVLPAVVSEWTPSTPLLKWKSPAEQVAEYGALATALPVPSDVEVDASDYERPRKPGEWLPRPHKDSPTVKP